MFSLTRQALCKSLSSKIGTSEEDEEVKLCSAVVLSAQTDAAIRIIIEITLRLLSNPVCTRIYPGTRRFFLSPNLCVTKCICVYTRILIVFAPSCIFTQPVIKALTNVSLMNVSAIRPRVSIEFIGWDASGFRWLWSLFSQKISYVGIEYLLTEVNDELAVCLCFVFGYLSFIHMYCCCLKETHIQTAAAMMLNSFCKETRLDYEIYLPQLFRSLIGMLSNEDSTLLSACWECLNSMVKVRAHKTDFLCAAGYLT